jgi:hypothetical protein
MLTTVAGRQPEPASKLSRAISSRMFSEEIKRALAVTYKRERLRWGGKLLPFTIYRAFFMPR